MSIRPHLLAAAALVALAGTASAQTVSNVSFVNGLALDGAMQDLSTGSAFDRRVGFFSDLYYDKHRNEWWGLSDRGPGGGTLPYETRVQRFTIDIGANGQISNFAVAQTVLFKQNGAAMNGLAPNPKSQLGRSFDPEGFVVNPLTGHFLVSDEYGPSLYEFDRQGNFVRAFATPGNLVPRSAADVPNHADDAGNSKGKRTNRGFEGLAISPDGRFAYAMLQSAMLDEGGGDGVYARIVKFDIATGQAVGQFAYRMETAGQGRGISALVALGNDKFLVLERNNRGIGVGATLNTADKNVYQIDLAGAADVTGVTLPQSGAFAGAVTKGPKVMDLDADKLAALGNKSPEKWEGLAMGPVLGNGKMLILAGTDNDYSVTQNANGVQFDVWFDFAAADPFAASIQCPIGQTTGCVFTTGGADATWSTQYALVPGVLHAYTADVAGYLAPIPEPQTYALMLAGLAAVGAVARRRRGNRP
jgi:hypothetical protein